jgi:hypothetical protein
MPQTHCYPTVTVTLLWKRHKLIATQQKLSHNYGNAIKDLICHNIYVLFFLSSSLPFLFIFLILSLSSRAVLLSVQRVKEDKINASLRFVFGHYRAYCLCRVSICLSTDLYSQWTTTSIFKTTTDAFKFCRTLSFIYCDTDDDQHHHGDGVRLRLWKAGLLLVEWHRQEKTSDTSTRVFSGNRLVVP